MEDVLERKVMTKFVVLRPKIYSHLIDDGDSDKKAKGTEKCIKKESSSLKIMKTVIKQLNLITQ